MLDAGKRNCDSMVYLWRFRTGCRVITRLNYSVDFTETSQTRRLGISFSEIYLVGGAWCAIELLQSTVQDRDWVVVGATPEMLIAQGYQQVGKDFPVFLHPQSKEEYALARTERKSGVGYGGFICDFSPDISLQQDLIQRV